MSRSDVETTGLLGRTLSLLQPRDGYRVTVDTVLLAAFAASGASRRPTRVVDLGAGVGALCLCFTRFASTLRVDLVEEDGELALLAAKNLAAASVTGEVHRVSLGRDPLPSLLARQAQVVLSNPPFHAEGAAQAPRHARTRASRLGEIGPFIDAAAAALAPRGRAYFVYPALRLAELLDAARDENLVAKRMRCVHPFNNSPARVVLVEFRRAKPGGLLVEPPLIEWQEPGRRSDEVAAIIDGRGGDRT